MFTHGNAYKKLNTDYILDMHENCPVCGQKFDLEPGFWYGTGYVSYALYVALSAATFVAWWVIIGVSTDDNRIFGWLIFNAVLIVVLQPWIMRLSRGIYLNFFVSYNENYDKDESKALYQ